MCKNLKGFLIIYGTLHRRCSYIYDKTTSIFYFLLLFYSKLSKLQGIYPDGAFNFLFFTFIQNYQNFNPDGTINVFFDPFDFRHQIYQIFHPPLSFLYPILQEMIGILKSQWPNLVALSMPTILMLNLPTPLEKISTFTK